MDHEEFHTVSNVVPEIIIQMIFLGSMNGRKGKSPSLAQSFSIQRSSGAGQLSSAGEREREKRAENEFDGCSCLWWLRLLVINRN